MVSAPQELRGVAGGELTLLNRHVNDFRFAADDWRAGRPNLARWYDSFRVRPSMQATEYVDAY